MTGAEDDEDLASDPSFPVRVNNLDLLLIRNRLRSVAVSQRYAELQRRYQQSKFEMSWAQFILFFLGWCFSFLSFSFLSTFVLCAALFLIVDKWRDWLVRDLITAAGDVIEDEERIHDRATQLYLERVLRYGEYREADREEARKQREKYPIPKERWVSLVRQGAAVEPSARVGSAQQGLFPGPSNPDPDD